VPLKIGLRRGHLVSDPALIRHVLLDNFTNYDKHTPAFDAVRVVLGNGMFTSGGSFWKRQRRIAQPAFHGESVKRFAPILSRMAGECADAWGDATRAGRTVNACDDMMQVTLRGVAETLFGDDMADSAAEINRVFPTILSCLAARVSSPLRPPLWMPTANNTKLKPALASLNGIVEQLIATKRRRIARGESDDAAHQDLLTILMLARDDETGEAMSDAQLRDEVISNPKSSWARCCHGFAGGWPRQMRSGQSLGSRCGLRGRLCCTLMKRRLGEPGFDAEMALDCQERLRLPNRSAV